MRMRAERPTMEGAIVKLNEAWPVRATRSSGSTACPRPAHPTSATSFSPAWRRWSWSPSRRLVLCTSPSSRTGPASSRSGSRATRCAARASSCASCPGRVELLSTHDQLLGGASGQSYLGCTFPASPEYARAITEQAALIGDRLAALGALGRFAIDFVVVRDARGTWTSYAIELNLRRGGTTHPFLTLQFLTDGRYHPDVGLFLTPGGRPKHLAATDHLESDLLRILAPADLVDIVARHGLLFDQSLQAGVVFHMISCLTEHGRVG
jgi:hypothetical protein